MTNWEWFAPALAILTAVVLWVGNSWREDRHRFTAEKRVVYADFIRAHRDYALILYEDHSIRAERAKSAALIAEGVAESAEIEAEIPEVQAEIDEVEARLQAEISEITEGGEVPGLQSDQARRVAQLAERLPQPMQRLHRLSERLHQLNGLTERIKQQNKLMEQVPARLDRLQKEVDATAERFQTSWAILVLIAPAELVQAAVPLSAPRPRTPDMESAMKDVIYMMRVDLLGSRRAGPRSG